MKPARVWSDAKYITRMCQEWVDCASSGGAGRQWVACTWGGGTGRKRYLLRRSSAPALVLVDGRVTRSARPRDRALVEPAGEVDDHVGVAVGEMVDSPVGAERGAVEGGAVLVGS